LHLRGIVAVKCQPEPGPNHEVIHFVNNVHGGLHNGMDPNNEIAMFGNPILDGVQSIR
jgi:hypothetical protein